MIAAWPEPDVARQDAEIEARFARFQSVLGALREIRSRQGIVPKQSIEFSVCCDADTVALLEPMENYFVSMAGAENVGWGPDVTAPPTCAKVSLPGMDVFVDLKDFIDVEAEIAQRKTTRKAYELDQRQRGQTIERQLCRSSTGECRPARTRRPERAARTARVGRGRPGRTTQPIKSVVRRTAFALFRRGFATSFRPTARNTG